MRERERERGKEGDVIDRERESRRGKTEEREIGKERNEREQGKDW